MKSCWVSALMGMWLCGCASSASSSKALGAQRALGHELIRRGDWDRAFAVVQPLCLEHPDDADGLLLRGLVYTQKRLLTEAEADLLESIRLDSKRSRSCTTCRAGLLTRSSTTAGPRSWSRRTPPT